MNEPHKYNGKGNPSINIKDDLDEVSIDDWNRIKEVIDNHNLPPDIKFGTSIVYGTVNMNEARVKEIEDMFYEPNKDKE